jgi:hypothetical protein
VLLVSEQLSHDSACSAKNKYFCVCFFLCEYITSTPKTKVPQR